MPEENNKAAQNRLAKSIPSEWLNPVRRSQTKKELEALGELIAILKPLSPEQRERLLKTAAVMLEP